ncbi:hypothetical protein IscW_ISCW016274 [Ixodes scapularis]|uniref:Uncharacterized protein n=1 Tax=Ixodes scapularis TaxID=6945 RepID=B7P213_IXOSC|nr:hypothetical protein IscW_ISCW016274 [Ixodes scapularis]|eukprot:XP_002401337.1 hypothetical protein IscW_ISCW016274 [Ixodes scapularis]
MTDDVFFRAVAHVGKKQLGADLFWHDSGATHAAAALTSGILKEGTQVRADMFPFLRGGGRREDQGGSSGYIGGWWWWRRCREGPAFFGVLSAPTTPWKRGRPAS